SGADLVRHASLHDALPILIVAADRARSLPVAGEASPADLLLLHETRQRLPTNVVHRRPEVDRRRRAVSGTPGGVRLVAVDVDPAASFNFPAHGLPRPVTERLSTTGRGAAAGNGHGRARRHPPAQRRGHVDPRQDAIVELLRRPVVVAGVSRRRELRLAVQPADQDGPLPGLRDAVLLRVQVAGPGAVALGAA